MARLATLRKIPRGAYRKNVQAPRLLPTPKVIKENPVHLGRKLAQNVLFNQLAENIVNKVRSEHIEQANVRFKALQDEGHFQKTEEVAVIVDGYQKPPRNVKFGGSIVYAERPDSGAMARRAQEAWLLTLNIARKWRKSGLYESRFQMFADGRPVDPSTIDRQNTNPNRYVIINDVPYAGKMERYHKDGVMAQAVRRMLRKGAAEDVSIQHRYIQSGLTTHTGHPLMYPIIEIGPLGSFTNRIASPTRYRRRKRNKK